MTSSTKRRNLGEHAARLSLYVAGLVIIIGVAGRASGLPAIVTLAWVNILLGIAGVLLGIAALVSMGQYGREGILGRALIGILANGLLVAAIASFVQPTMQTQSMPTGITGRWQLQMSADPRVESTDMQFDPDGTFKATIRHKNSVEFAIDGRWVMNSSRVLELTIEHNNGAPVPAATKASFGMVRVLDETNLTLETRYGDNVYKRLP